MNRLAPDLLNRLTGDSSSRGLPTPPGDGQSGETTPDPGEGLRILVLEEDLLLAGQLARDIRRAGDMVVGPFSSVGAALRLEGRADAAILDIEVGQELSFPLADRFQAGRRPFLFHTGLPASTLPVRLKHASLHRKPSRTAELLADLHRQARPAVPLPGPCDLIPQLQVLARQLIHDSAAADRLIEAVLVEAVRELEDCPPHGLSDWLLARLEYEFCRNGRGYMI